MVTAINGDFFSDYKNGQSFSLGVEVKDENKLYVLKDSNKEEIDSHEKIRKIKEISISE